MLMYPKPKKSRIKKEKGKEENEKSKIDGRVKCVDEQILSVGAISSPRGRYNNRESLCSPESTSKLVINHGPHLSSID